MAEQKYVSTNNECRHKERQAPCNVWIPWVMRQRIRATEKSDFPILFLGISDHYFTKDKMVTILLFLCTFNRHIWGNGYFLMSLIIWIFEAGRGLSPSQLLDLTEDCWSQAWARWGRQSQPLIGQYWDHPGLPLVEILQPESHQVTSTTVCHETWKLCGQLYKKVLLKLLLPKTFCQSHSTGKENQ